MTTELLREGTAAFLASVTRQVGVLTLELQGEADLHAVGSLSLLLPRLHLQASQWFVKEVVVDLRRLEFMNSSCFKTVAMWVAKVQEREGEPRYRIRFRLNPSTAWQKRSLNALRCMAPDVVSIDP